MSKTKAEMIETITSFYTQYTLFAEVVKYKTYPCPDCLAEFHKDTVAECYHWIMEITSTDLWSKTLAYWKQQTQVRWMSYHSLWGDPTEFEDFNDLKELVKSLKAQIKWTKRPKALIVKHAAKFKKHAAKGEA